MSQNQWIILLFKIVIVADAAAILVFIADYTRLAPWWRNTIGRTLVIKDILLLIPLAVSSLSLFFDFNRLTSHIAAWITVISFGLIGPVMLWRTVVFERVHRQKAAPAEPGETETEEVVS